MKKTKTSVLILFLLPSFILLGVFFIAPALWAIYVSFTNMALTGPTALHWNFTWLQNYIHLFSDSGFIKSFEVTLYFLFGSVGGQFMLGLLLAVYLKGKPAFVRLAVESLAIIAWVMPEVVGGFNWISFLSYPAGLLNKIISAVGLHSEPWLFTHPLFSVTLANVWHGMAFSLLLFIAALDGIPREIIEAARIDGSNSLQIFYYVTIPMIKSSILTDLILITLFTMGEFSLIFTMTSGGPGMESCVLSIYAYRQALSFYDVSYGSAISVVMLIMGMVISVFYVLMARSSPKSEKS